jgi:hypothetical protein
LVIFRSVSGQLPGLSFSQEKRLDAAENPPSK